MRRIASKASEHFHWRQTDGESGRDYFSLLFNQPFNGQNFIN